jgi:hypothetical protein
MIVIDIYLEVGSKRVFAAAIDWPGWCRSGRQEAAALESLLAYGPRYEQALADSGLTLQVPTATSSFNVVERLKGDATTDFGAPGAMASDDSLPVSAAELRRFKAVLRGCWRDFDRAVEAAHGKPLRKGPRGGGRELDAVVQHVLDADGAYLWRLGRNVERGRGGADEDLDRTREAVLEALDAAVRGDVPTRGRRGGARWTARHFVRRVAWHVLDHAWEIEDRVQ